MQRVMEVSLVFDSPTAELEAMVYVLRKELDGCISVSRSCCVTMARRGGPSRMWRRQTNEDMLEQLSRTIMWSGGECSMLRQRVATLEGDLAEKGKEEAASTELIS